MGTRWGLVWSTSSHTQPRRGNPKKNGTGSVHVAEVDTNTDKLGNNRTKNVCYHSGLAKVRELDRVAAKFSADDHKALEYWTHEVLDTPSGPLSRMKKYVGSFVFELFCCRKTPPEFFAAKSALFWVLRGYLNPAVQKLDLLVRVEFKAN